MDLLFIYRKLNTLTSSISISKNKYKNPLNQKGTMLVQVLISAGLTTALALTVASLLVQQNKQIKFMEQKSEIIDIKNEILMALSNPQVCGCNFNPAKLIPLNSNSPIEFNTSPAELTITEGLRNDCNDSTIAFLKANEKTQSNLKVESIKVSNLTRVGLTSNWNGRLKVKFSGSNIALKDLSLPINVETSGAGPFQVDTCSVVDNIDQTASCNSLGGSIVGGKCIIQDPQANCQSLGGSIVDGKCLIQSPQANCQSLGGTFDTNTNKCNISRPTNNTADCTAIYGTGWTHNGTTCVPPAGKYKPQTITQYEIALTGATGCRSPIRETAPHSFCSTSGIYQHGDNGVIKLIPNVPDANGLRKYTIHAVHSDASCRSGAIILYVDCYD